MGGVWGAKASTGFARNLRKAMYENIQTFSFSNIDKFSTAGLVTRLTTDVTNVQNAYQMKMCIRDRTTTVAKNEKVTTNQPATEQPTTIAYKDKADIAISKVLSLIHIFRPYRSGRNCGA